MGISTTRIPVFSLTGKSATRSTPTFASVLPGAISTNLETRANTPKLSRLKASIIAAWKAKIDKDGPPSVDDHEKVSDAGLTKTLWDIGHVARVILDLDWLKDSLDLEAAIENDNSPPPARLRAIITELCGFLDALVTEETGEIVAAEEDSASLAPQFPEMLAMAAGTAGIARPAALLEKGKPNMRNFGASLLAKAKHSQSDQALVDLAHLACDKCLKIGGLSVDEKEHMDKACEHLCRAGAVPIEDPQLDTMDENRGSESPRMPASQLRPADASRVDTAKVLGVVAAGLSKRGRAHQPLMDVAHECVSELTDGMTCGEAAKIEARHSGDTVEHLEAAHRHLVAAGAKCETAGIAGPSELTDEEQLDADFEPGKGARVRDFAKALAGERAEKAALVKVLDQIVPMLERLTKRVDDIARTPLPPLTIAKGTMSVSKQQDGGGASGSEADPSSEAITAALAKMSKEEQTLMLIKASYANPIRVLGSAGGEAYHATNS
jgi:hypothetical protein